MVGEEEETGAIEEGQQRQHASTPPPVSIIEDKRQPSEGEQSQGEAWFEAVTDPALWKNTHSERAKAFLIDRGALGVKVFHNRCANYPASIRDSGIGVKTRVLTNEQLTCRLPNGQVVDRQWITYSPSTRNIYCFPCKLFSSISSIRFWLL